MRERERVCVCVCVCVLLVMASSVLYCRIVVGVSDSCSVGYESHRIEYTESDRRCIIECAQRQHRHINTNPMINNAAMIKMINTRNSGMARTR
jgi:hypothetical protein